MIRVLAGLLALVVVGLPLMIAPSELTGGLAVIAGTLCAAGIAALSTRLLAAGAAVSLVGYALALLSMADSPDPLGAVVLGVVLSLLLQVVGFAATLRGAAVDPRVLPGQVRYWVSSGVGAAAAGILLGISAGDIALRLPLPAYPAAVALGALAVYLGAVRAMMRGLDRPGSGQADERG
jgi:hypothetical protein